MKNKKKIAFFVLNVMFFSLCFSSIFGVTSVNVKKAQAKAGENVDVNVEIVNNSGIVGAEIVVKYDKSKLEYIDGKQGSVLDGKMAVISENDGSVKLVCVGENIAKNGDIMNLQFKVKNDVKESYIPIYVEVEKMINDVGDSNIVDVENTTTNGNIMVISDSEIEKNDDDSINVIKNENGSYDIKNKDESRRVTYTTSDENIATVDENGNVTPQKSGEVKITANYEDGKVEEVVLNIPESTLELKENDISFNVEEKNSNNDEVTKNNISKKISKKKIAIISVSFVILLCIIYLLIKRKKNNEKEKW